MTNQINIRNFVNLFWTFLIPSILFQILVALSYIKIWLYFTHKFTFGWMSFFQYVLSEKMTSELYHYSFHWNRPVVVHKLLISWKIWHYIVMLAELTFVYCISNQWLSMIWRKNMHFFFWSCILWTVHWVVSLGSINRGPNTVIGEYLVLELPRFVFW